MKQCTKCKIDKELNMFSICRSNNDGFQYWCKGCRKVYTKAYNSKSIVKKQKHKYYIKRKAKNEKM